MKFLFQNTPDGRNKLWTLIFVLLVPTPLILLLLSLTTEGVRNKSTAGEFIFALIGLALFVFLWSVQVIKGSYDRPLKSSLEERLYSFSGWALIFLFVLMTNSFVKSGLADLGFERLAKDKLLLTMIFFLLSYAGWAMGKTFKRLSESTLARSYKRHQSTDLFLSPHNILEQTILGLLGYIFFVLMIYIIYSFTFFIGLHDLILTI